MSEIYTTRSGLRAVVLTKDAPGYAPWIGYLEYRHPAPREGLVTAHATSWAGLGGSLDGFETEWDLVREGFEVTPAEASHADA